MNLKTLEFILSRFADASVFGEDERETHVNRSSSFVGGCMASRSVMNLVIPPVTDSHRSMLERKMPRSLRRLTAADSNSSQRTMRWSTPRGLVRISAAAQAAISMCARTSVVRP